MYENFGFGINAKLVDCRVAERVTSGTLRWFGHGIRLTEDDCGVYKARFRERVIRRPPVKWIYRIDEYWKKLTSEELNVMRRSERIGKCRGILLFGQRWVNSGVGTGCWRYIDRYRK